MAKMKVIHNEDCCMIIFKGDKSNPEPHTGVIKFPGGHVEVSRCEDGTYWAHIVADESVNIIDSRIDYNYEGYQKSEPRIPQIPMKEHIKKMAIKIDGPFVQAGD